MITSNISLGKGVNIHPTASINNVTIGDNVKIAKECTIFGHPDFPLEIGHDSIIAMYAILNGYAAPMKIGAHCSIGQQSHFMTDSGPTASPKLLKLFPIVSAPVTIGDHCWVGSGCIIIPGVTIGECSIVASNSFVNKDIPPYSVYGGNPARLIKKLDPKDLE